MMSVYTGHQRHETAFAEGIRSLNSSLNKNRIGWPRVSPSGYGGEKAVKDPSLHVSAALTAGQSCNTYSVRQDFVFTKKPWKHKYFEGSALMPAFKITFLGGRNDEAEIQEKHVLTLRFSLSYAFDLQGTKAATKRERETSYEFTIKCNHPDL